MTNDRNKLAEQTKKITKFVIAIEANGMIDYIESKHLLDIISTWKRYIKLPEWYQNDTMMVNMAYIAMNTIYKCLQDSDKLMLDMQGVVWE